MTETPAVVPVVRLRSLDALRGFDMFWIIGGDAIASELSKIAGNPIVAQVCIEFSDHMKWAGFRYYDMIFPLFLFIIGAVIPFSVGARVEAGDDKRKIWLKVAQRAAILFLLGLIYNGMLEFRGWDHLRVFGVLQRQAFGYFAAATLFLFTNTRTQIVVAVGCILFYWFLLLAIPVPGFGHGNMTPEGNAANYIDRLILQPKQMYESYGDPEGPLSDIPAITTALLGLFAGKWLKSARTPEKKAAGLAIAGVVCLALGLAWSPLLPIIKKIWTGSYVLVAGGFSLELLALFYWIIDVKGYWRWSMPLIVIGSNAILVYMLSDIVEFDKIGAFFFAGALRFVPTLQPIGMAVATVLAEWFLLNFLYKRKIFIRI